MVTHTDQRKLKSKPKGRKPMSNKQILAIESFPISFLSILLLSKEKRTKDPQAFEEKGFNMRKYLNKEKKGIK